MDKSHSMSCGTMNISYEMPGESTPYTIKVDGLPHNSFMTFVKTGTNAVKQYNSKQPNSIVITEQTEREILPRTSEGNLNIRLDSPSEDPEAMDSKPSVENDMSDLSRNEIQALLKANKAEVDAVASSMQADMAKWRELMSSDLKEIKSLVSSQHASINSRLDLQSVRIETALESHSKKIDAALSIQEAKLEGKLSDVKLEIIKWALGLPALAFALYKIYGVMSGNPTP